MIVKVLLVLFSLFECLRAEVVDLTDSDLSKLQSVLNAGENALLYFYGDRCAFCKAYSDMYSRLSDNSAQYTRDPSLLFFRINTDQAPELAARFFIRVVPTVFHFNGGRIYALSKDQRGDLWSYFSERSWGKMKPVGWLQSPFGLWGAVFGRSVRLGFWVLAEARARNISNAQLTVLGVIATLLIWSFAAFLGYMSRPADDAPVVSGEGKRKKKKNE